MTAGFDPYAALLKEASKRSVAGAFSQFLDKEINITSGTRSRASDSHNNVRDKLVDESDRDAKFPRILRDADTDFLGGSFSRHTKIWPLDDIDIYFPLDGCGLSYMSQGRTLPYTVLTDDASLENPLIKGGNRWMDGSNISSKKLIDGFASVLRGYYPSTTRIRSAGEAVNVKTTSFGFDIVPCFALRNNIQFASTFYLIPDGNNGWIHTNPRIDQDVSLRLQSRNAKSHRPAVKLIKWWNLNRFAKKFGSYYAELAIMRSLDLLNNAGVAHTSISEAVTHGFGALNAAALNGDMESWIPNAPPVEAPVLNIAERTNLLLTSIIASNALAKEQVGDVSGALKEWAKVFGDSFPTE